MVTLAQLDKISTLALVLQPLKNKVQSCDHGSRCPMNRAKNLTGFYICVCVCWKEFEEMVEMALGVVGKGWPEGR
jgi:hypothetical protein